jgi:hypothetical protein
MAGCGAVGSAASACRNHYRTAELSSWGATLVDEHPSCCSGLLGGPQTLHTMHALLAAQPWCTLRRALGSQLSDCNMHGGCADMSQFWGFWAIGAVQ